MKKILLIAVLATVLLSCGNKDSAANSDSKQFILDGDYITLADNSSIMQNISFEEVTTSSYRSTFTTSGTVQAIPSRYAEIGSPFAGRIVKSFVKLGQKINAGSPIFEIHSPSFQESGKLYYQAKQEMELALKNLNRERDLHSNRIGSIKSLEESEANYELKKQDYEQSVAALEVYQMHPDDITPGLPLIIRSPIDGEVVKENIVTGQYIREDAAAQAIVADLARVWVIAHVKEKDIPFAQDDATVEINLLAIPGQRFQGMIRHIGDLLDEETRSIEIVIECDNASLKMKPFMYGTVTFTNVPVETISIPRKAILQDEDRRYVLVDEGNKRFRKAGVTVASDDSKTGNVAVLSGISQGEKIVTTGAFYFINAR